jgi:hypothetical protein
LITMEENSASLDAADCNRCTGYSFPHVLTIAVTIDKGAESKQNEL